MDKNQFKNYLHHVDELDYGKDIINPPASKATDLVKLDFTDINKTVVYASKSRNYMKVIYNNNDSTYVYKLFDDYLVSNYQDYIDCRKSLSANIQFVGSYLSDVFPDVKFEVFDEFNNGKLRINVRYSDESCDYDCLVAHYDLFEVRNSIKILLDKIKDELELSKFKRKVHKELKSELIKFTKSWCKKYKFTSKLDRDDHVIIIKSGSMTTSLTLI